MVLPEIVTAVEFVAIDMPLPLFAEIRLSPVMATRLLVAMAIPLRVFPMDLVTAAASMPILLPII